MSSDSEQEVVDSSNPTQVPLPATKAALRAMRDADTKRPHISVLAAPSPFTKPKLSKTAANFDTWSWNMQMHLGSTGFWRYIQDNTSIRVPNRDYQPNAYANYRTNSDAAKYFLVANIDPKEAKHLKLLDEPSPHVLYTRLEAIYGNPGPTRQLKLMEKCFDVFLCNDAKMIDQFDDLMDMAFRAFRNMTENTWQCLIGVRAMGRDSSLSQARTLVLDAMAAAETAGKTDSYTPEHIRDILIRHHNESGTAPIAL
ncbi:hypothetical protein CVT24_005626, partial [Panaeolus cyanescens]